MNNKLALIVQFSGIDNLSGSLRNIIGLGRTGSGALRTLQADANRLKREMREVGQAISSSSGNVTQLINRERALAGEIAKTTRLINERKAALEVSARADAIRQQGESLTSQGQANIIQGASLAAPLLLAAKAAADYSTALVDIQQKADLSDAATERMGRTMLRIAADTRQLPSNIAAAVDNLAGMGLDPRLAIQLAPAIGRLGTAFRVELADGAAAAHSNLSNLKVPISEASRAIDIMAASGNLGAFEVRDMARSFPSLTGQFNALGETGLTAVGRLSAALQIARKTTGTSDEAANNVQNLLTKINAPGTIRAFEKNFGVNLPAAMARLRAEGYDTFEAIAMITRQATGGDLSKLGFAFEDMQAQAGIRTLIQNLDEYRRVRDAAMAGEGTVNRAFDQRVLRDANVSWQAFMGSVSTLGITLGTTLLPTLTEVANSLNAGLQWVSAWAQANPEAAGAIMKTVGALAAMRIGLGAAQMAFGSILGPFASFYRFFAKVDGISQFGIVISRTAFFVTRGITLMSQAFGILRVAALFMARGVMQAGLMMLANPLVLAITLIVLAIAGAAYAIYSYWDEIKGYFTRNWTTIRNLFLGAVVIFTPFIAAIIWVAKKVYDNWDNIKAGALRFLSWIGSFITPVIAVWRGMWTGFKSSAQTFLGWIGGIVGPFLAPFLSIMQFLIGLHSRFFTFGVNLVQGLINGVRSMLSTLWSALTEGLGGIGEWFAGQLGIASPSRVFMAYGGNIVDGLALGVDRQSDRAFSSLSRLADGSANAFQTSPSAFASAPDRGVQVGGQSAQGAAPVSISIQIYQQPGEDAEHLAQRVLRMIEQRRGEGGGSYGDG